jgi:hypothetical protein
VSLWGVRGGEGGVGRREEGGRPMRVACRRLRAEDKAAAGERLPNVPRPAPLEPGRTCRHVCRHVRSGQKGRGGEKGRMVERLTSLHSLHLPPATLPLCSLPLFLPSPTRAFLTSRAGTRWPWVSACACRKFWKVSALVRLLHKITT